eukprot:scaffold28850_cov41-Attheya_sp.AAC.1
MPLREETTSGFFDRSTEFVDWESTDVSEQEASSASSSSRSPTTADSSAASSSNTTLTSAQDDNNEPVSIQASWLRTNVVYLSAPSATFTPAYQTGYLRQPSSQNIEVESVSVAPSYSSSTFKSAPSVGDELPPPLRDQAPSSSLSSSSSSSLSKQQHPGTTRPGTPIVGHRQRQRRRNHISFPIDEEEKDSHGDEHEIDYSDAKQQHSQIKSTTIIPSSQQQAAAESIETEAPKSRRKVLFRRFTVSSLTMPMFSSRRAGSSGSTSSPRIHNPNKHDNNAPLASSSPNPKKRGSGRNRKCLLWVGLFFFVVTISLAVALVLINPDQDPLSYFRDIFGIQQRDDDMTVDSQVPSLHPTTTSSPTMAPSSTVTSPQSPTAVTTLAPTKGNIRGQRTRRPGRPSLMTLQEPEAFCSGSNSSPTRVCQSSVECVLQSLFEQTNGCEWKDNKYWLSTTAHVCDWYGIQCNDDTDYPQIVGLSLPNNQLKGQLPSELGLLLPLLRTLQLDGNELTGPIVPSWLWSSSSLLSLEEWSVSNNSLTGTIPTEIGFMALSLKRLNLKSNDNVVGTLPTELGLLTELTYLNLSKNYLKGTIPTELAHLSNHLEYLNVGQNVLRGSLPDAVFSKLTSLTFLSSYYNLHTGTLPAVALSRLTNLQTLDLGLCERLQGSVPTVLGTLTNLQFLALEGNILTGTLPTELGALTDMKYLGLYGNNDIQGTIPSELGALSSLQELRLEDTQLTGEVPSQVCTLVSNGDLNEFYADCHNGVDCSCFASCCPAIPLTNGIIIDDTDTSTTDPVAIDRTNIFARTVPSS